MPLPSEPPSHYHLSPDNLALHSVVACEYMFALFLPMAGKYMSVDMMGNVSGRSDAIGPQEQFECVFEGDKAALETYNGCFLSVSDEGQLSATKKIVGEKETFCIRTSAVKV